MKTINPNDFYVIVDSWDDVLYKLEAWSKNYYIANMYYTKYKKTHPDALLKVYETDERLKTLHLANTLKKEFDTDVDTFIGSELKLISSEDGKLCAIYKDKYKYSFMTSSSDMEQTLFNCIRNSIAEVFLRSAPLVKYIQTPIDLLEILFRAHIYTTNSKRVNIDMIYLWYFILKNSKINILIPQNYGEVIPIDTVFISVNE